MSDFLVKFFFSFTLEILLKNFNTVKIDCSFGGESRFLTNVTRFFISDDPVMGAMFTAKRLFFGHLADWL